MSLHYSKFELIELLEIGVYSVMYMDNENRRQSRCLTLNRDIIGELDALPPGFHSVMEAADYKGGKEAIAALDINSKEWHIFYLENAIRMKKYDDNGTF
jgi:hypothetical protein|tara:strand:+ start:342 stop:638 length:297 start_codon:yes stop_codon:yes gene_type:complete